MIENTYAKLAGVAEQGVKHTTSIGYSFSAGTLFAELVPFIDAHSWVVGLFGIVLTWMTNILFRVIDRLNKFKT